MAFTLYLGVFLCAVATVFSQQKYGRAIKTFNEIWIYAFITGVISSINFIFLSGFTFDFNLNILVYSLIITALSQLSYFASLIALKYMEISVISVLQNGGNLILSVLLGMFIFSETPGFVSAVRIACTLAAILSIYLIGRKKRSEEKKKNTAIGLLLCTLSAAVLASFTVTSKFVATDPAVKNSNHVFFLSNVFIAAVSAAAMLFNYVKNKNLDTSYAKGLSSKRFFLIFLCTVASNVSAMLGVLILKTGNIDLYAPISGALNIIAAEVVAVLIAKEKTQIIPITFSVAAILLGLLG